MKKQETWGNELTVQHYHPSMGLQTPNSARSHHTGATWLLRTSCCCKVCIHWAPSWAGPTWKSSMHCRPQGASHLSEKTSTGPAGGTCICVSTIFYKSLWATFLEVFRGLLADQSPGGTNQIWRRCCVGIQDPPQWRVREESGRTEELDLTAPRLITCPTVHLTWNKVSQPLFPFTVPLSDTAGVTWLCRCSSC